MRIYSLTRSLFARNNEAFVVKPQALVLLQNLGRIPQIIARGVDLLEAHVLDLRHVDRRVPCGEQRGCAYALLHLARQRMHLVAEHGLGVRTRDEVVVPGISAELLTQHLDQLVPIDPERILVRPDLADQLERGVVAARLYRKKPPAGTETAY